MFLELYQKLYEGEVTDVILGIRIQRELPYTPAISENKPLEALRENALEEKKATYPSILAWEIPLTEEPGRLCPYSHRVGHD